MNKVLKGTFMVCTRPLMTDLSQTGFLFLIRLILFLLSLFLYVCDHLPEPLLYFSLSVSHFLSAPHPNREFKSLHISLYGQINVS